MVHIGGSFRERQAQEVLSMAAEDLPRSHCWFCKGKLGKERLGDKERGSDRPGVSGGDERSSFSGRLPPHAIQQGGIDRWLITEEEKSCLNSLLADSRFKPCSDGTTHSRFEKGVANAPNRLIRHEGFYFIGIGARHDPDGIRSCLESRIDGMKEKRATVPQNQGLGASHPGRFAGGKDNGSDSVHTVIDALVKMAKRRGQ